MATNREISIILRAKNAMAAGLSKAKASVQAFGRSALKIGKFFAKAFLGAGAAVAGFAAKAISAYSESEKAERSLVAAMNAHGEAGDALLPSLKKIAAAIQDETGAADESTLAGMAKMRMLGVQTSQMEEAAKAVIALKSVGLEEAAAQKAVAMALQGNYEMLNRYVPALRSATSDTEKAQIVNELFARGYEQQKELLDTVGGRWGALKGRVGDLWEEMGRAIVQNDSLKGSLDRAGEAVKAFTGKVSEWIDSGGAVRLVAGVKLFYEEFKRAFMLGVNRAEILWASLQDGAETAFSYVGNLVGAYVENIKARFGYIGKLAGALWEKVTHPTRPFQAPSLDEVDAAEKRMVDALKGKNAVTTRLTENALAKRKKIEEDYADATAEIAKEETKSLEAQAKRQAEAAAAAAKAEAEAAEYTAEVVKKKSKEELKTANDLLQQKLKGINEEKKAAEELAKSTVQAVIDAANAEKKVMEERAKDKKKAEGLEEKVKRGTKLGKKDEEWLSAYKSIVAAQAALEKGGSLAKAETTVKAQIAAMKESLKTEKDMASSLSNIEDSLNKNLQY